MKKKDIKLKKLLKEGHTIMPTNFSAFGGGIVTLRPINNMPTLKSFVKEEWVDDDRDSFNEETFIEAVTSFNKYKAHIYREGNLKQVAEELGQLANDARTHALKETDGWFDKVTVNRNMKELANLSKNFNKTSKEAQAVQERVEGLYEDMGNILSRYYEIKDLEDGCVKGKKHVKTEEDGLREDGKYQAFFKKALDKFGVDSPDELGDKQKKALFNWVDKNWKAEDETD